MSDLENNEEEQGYVKFVFKGIDDADDPEFTIETSFPTGLSINDTIDFMAQMFYYIHNGDLTEQNASSVLETCSDVGQYELGAKIIQRWHQYEESNSQNPSANSPCVSPSSIFPRIPS